MKSISHLFVITVFFLSLMRVESAPPTLTIDLKSAGEASNVITRVHAAANNGSRGVPVFGGNDVDGDGFADYGLGLFQSSPLGRFNAGFVNMVLGTGELGGTVDGTFFASNQFLIAGATEFEYCGSEVWMNDVTGDGLGDIIICRQSADYDDNGTNRNAAGALSVVIGGPEIRDHAATLSYLDLANPSTNITVVTFFGSGSTDRLGIWVRTGDVDGDGIHDIVVGEDQNDIQGSNAGAVYVIRGGSHLNTNLAVDMASYGTSPLGAHIARWLPPASSADYHLGATVTVGDLDGNGRAEVIAAATLNRAGAGVGDGGIANSGAPRGRVFIAWDDNFTTNLWTNGHNFVIDQAPGTYSAIQGGSTILLRDGTVLPSSNNDKLGEELLAGLDYNGDGKADLFLGDITARVRGRVNSGCGWVIFNPEDSLKNEDFVLDSQPSWPTNFSFTVIPGPEAGAISSDTASHGDYNNDGIDDLMIGSPCDDTTNGAGSGSIQLIYGHTNDWPQEFDLAENALPTDSNGVVVVELIGVKTNDVLCYSAADGDINGDGIADLLVNEMLGDNPFSGQINPGNLVVINGIELARDPDGDGVVNFLDEDDDGDTIPDTWEEENGLNATNAADATVDQDMDGHTAIQEYISNTGPFDSNSVFVVSSIAASGTVYTVTWDSQSNRFYDVHCATSLDTNAWSVVVTNIPGDGTVMERVLTNAAEGAFYRIEVDLTP